MSESLLRWLLRDRNTSEEDAAWSEGACFALERVDQVFDEVLPLLRSHYEEIAFYPDIVLDPRLDLYKSLDAAGKLRVYTVRVRSELVGYAVFSVDFSVHYGASLQATQDVLYLRSDMRGKTIGIRFIRWCDDELRAEHVQVVYQHVKVGHPMLGRVLTKLGYHPQDTIYSRRLD